MSTQQFNAPEELKAVRCSKRIQRRTSYHRSRLAKLHVELVKLRDAGASYRELALWLRKTKRIKVAHTTVMRYLENDNEQKENTHA